MRLGYKGLGMSIGERMRSLLLGAGRRVSFASALSEYSEVYSYEIEENVPISCVAKVIKGKSWKDEDILSDIYKKIIDLGIDVIIPLDDAATVLCTQLKPLSNKHFWPVVSSNFTTNTCYDKSRFELFFRNHLPLMYPWANPGQPAIIKPIHGYGSRGIFTVDRYDKYDFERKHSATHIAQKFIKGQEYSVDAYFGRNGKMIDAIPRTRLRVANGEVLDSQTVYHELMIQKVEEIHSYLQFRGPICLQFIEEEFSKYIYIMEINARFGGGCILSMEAGVPMLRFIRDEWQNGETHHIPFKWRRGLLMRRVNREFFFTNSKV
jgi:carbamoyl-phosphate synthase large subunit